MLDALPRAGSRTHAGTRMLPLLALAVAVLLALAVPPAEAFTARGFLESTNLLDIRQGSARSATARQAGRAGFELADGRRLDLTDWYSTGWTELQVDFLTELEPGLGLIWGFSTGERGRKYEITPGLRLGFVWSLRPSPTSILSLTATTLLGSVLSERACTADYGIMGVQRVNCRLAASPLAPERTLKHRLKANGLDDSRVSLAFELRF